VSFPICLVSDVPPLLSFAIFLVISIDNEHIQENISCPGLWRQE
jgi:hypothetical protein